MVTRRGESKISAELEMRGKAQEGRRRGREGPREKSRAEQAAGGRGNGRRLGLGERPEGLYMPPPPGSRPLGAGGPVPS